MEFIYLIITKKSSHIENKCRDEQMLKLLINFTNEAGYFR